MNKNYIYLYNYFFHKLFLLVWYLKSSDHKTNYKKVCECNFETSYKNPITCSNLVTNRVTLEYISLVRSAGMYRLYIDNRTDIWLWYGVDMIVWFVMASCNKPNTVKHDMNHMLVALLKVSTLNTTLHSIIPHVNNISHKIRNTKHCSLSTTPAEVVIGCRQRAHMHLPKVFPLQITLHSITSLNTNLNIPLSIPHILKYTWYTLHARKLMNPYDMLEP